MCCCAVLGHGCTSAYGRERLSVRFSIRADDFETVLARSLTVRWLVAQLRQIPDFHGLVPTPREQPPAVWAEGHAADESGVAAEAAHQLAAIAVPDFHGAILTRGRDPAAGLVRAEGDGVDFPAMPSERRLQFLGGLCVPDLDRTLLTARSQASAIGTERHIQTRHAGRPGVQRVPGLLFLVQAGGVPEFHNAVVTCRGQIAAVGAKHHRTDRCAAMATERIH